MSPIKLKLTLDWNIDPRDHLPDDFNGTREEAIDWIKTEIAENLASCVIDSEIYHSHEKNR